jgi:hypothetical protein
LSGGVPVTAKSHQIAVFCRAVATKQGNKRMHYGRKNDYGVYMDASSIEVIPKNIAVSLP